MAPQPSPARHPASPLPPIVPRENGTAEEKKVPENDASPMKAAADLIQSLDNAYSEMTHFAADAARDAETARRNARAASEIARRYLNRSYPKVQTPFGVAPSTPERHNNKQHEVVKAEDALQEINGIASALQTPREEQKYSFEPTPSRNRRTYNTPMSSERIAQSHAEDVLGLTVDLERTRQALKSELRMHEDTKASLASFQSRHKSLEEQNQKLLEELERTKMEAQNRTSQLEQELQIASTRVQAAEEDAQLALDLAKDSAEKNDQLEEWLQKASEEIRILNEEKASRKLETPKRSVRFADTTPPLPPPAPPQQEMTPLHSTPRGGGPSREMVAAGRQLLRRRLGSPEDEIITLELTPAKSAERRRRLRERLTQQQNFDVSTPQKSPQRPESRTSNKIVEECKNSAKLLQQSGQRLDLGGHWWREQRGHHEINLEAMTRQYCQSVEFSIERQRKEINELGSLCGYLEKKLVTGN